jgi:hypothetical protein
MKTDGRIGFSEPMCGIGDDSRTPVWGMAFRANNVISAIGAQLRSVS